VVRVLSLTGPSIVLPVPVRALIGPTPLAREKPPVLPLPLALAHSVPVPLAPSIIGRRAIWRPGLAVGDQGVGIGGIQWIQVPVGVGIERVGAIDELPEVGPAVVVTVEELVPWIGGVEAVGDLPTVRTAPSVGVGVEGVGARPELVQVAQAVPVGVPMGIGGVVGAPRVGRARG
jgi:hypothetical protein